MSDMGKKGLLDCLAHSISINRKTTDSEDRQAYAQLRKIVEQHFAEQSGEVDEDCSSREACVYYLPGTLGPNCLYIGVDELIETYKYPMSGKSDPASIAEDLERFAKELLTQKRVVDEDYLLSEFDNLYASAHDGYLPTDEEFECNLEHCPRLYRQIKQLLTQKRVVSREEIRETVRYLEMATDPISAEGALEEKLKELGMEVEEAEEEREQEPMDKETAADKKFHELKDEGRLDRFGRRKE